MYSICIYKDSITVNYDNDDDSFVSLIPLVGYQVLEKYRTVKDWA